MFRSALICLLTATPVLAQDLPDQGAAKRLLFSTRNSTITVLPQPFLAAEDIAALEAMPKVAGLKYYGALAAALRIEFRLVTPDLVPSVVRAPSLGKVSRLG